MPDDLGATLARIEASLDQVLVRLGGGLGVVGLEEQIRGLDRRIAAMESDGQAAARRRWTVGEKVVAFGTSLATSLAGTIAYLKLSGHH